MQVKIVLILFVLLTPGWAVGDQNDPHLDFLFAQLAKTNNPVSANNISQHIWRIWKQTDNPNYETQLKHGIEAMQRRDFATALSILDPLIERAPAFAEAWNTRATLRYLRNDYALSIADIEQTLKLEPRHFGALSGLGLIYTIQGKTIAAIKAFEQALKINPHMPGPKRHLRNLKIRLNKQVI